MLDVKEIHFRHGRHGKEILKGISLRAERGEIVTILGPNGSGKTTLFRCIGGLWKPESGTVTVDGRDFRAGSYEERARMFATVPQEHTAPFPYTVFEVVLMGRAGYVGIFATPGQRDRALAEEALRTTGIYDLKDKAYTKLSGGEKQLVLIGRALAQEAPVMLLDEPVSHLDFRHQILILRKIRDVTRQKGLIVLMTLHDSNLAMLFSDRVALMKAGTIIAEGNPESVISEENLRHVYDIGVRVITWNGCRIVYPEGNP